MQEQNRHNLKPHGNSYHRHPSSKLIYTGLTLTSTMQEQSKPLQQTYLHSSNSHLHSSNSHLHRPNSLSNNAGTEHIHSVNLSLTPTMNRRNMNLTIRHHLYSKPAASNRTETDTKNYIIYLFLFVKFILSFPTMYLPVIQK